MLTFRFPLWLSLTSYWQTELGRPFSPTRTTTPGVWGNVFPWRLGLQALEKYRTRRQNQVVTLPTNTPARLWTNPVAYHCCCTFLGALSRLSSSKPSKLSPRLHISPHNALDFYVSRSEHQFPLIGRLSG